MRYGTGAEAAPIVAARSRPVGAGGVELWESGGSSSSRNRFSPAEAEARAGPLNRTSSSGGTHSSPSLGVNSGSVNSTPGIVTSRKVLDTVRSVLGLPGEVSFCRSSSHQTTTSSAAGYSNNFNI